MKNPPLHSDKEYKEYMKAYDEFFNKKLSIFEGGSPRLDSQFSESIAADYFEFNLDHKDGFDGHNSNGESCEVKGTGYNNSRVKFTVDQRSAQHIYWVKADGKNKAVEIQEIDLSACASEFNKDGFITLGSQSSKMKVKTSYTLKY